jgi:hypothetical protein
MDKKVKVILWMSVVVFPLCMAGCMDSGGLGITGKVGTLGVGGELTTRVISNINARVGINSLETEFDGEIDDVDYDVGVDLLSYTAMLDWHIFDDDFRISAGVILNNNELALDARPSRPVQIGSIWYTPAQVGTLKGGVDFDEIAPYIGVGWGNALDRNKRWGLTCDFGVAFMQSPDVSLSANGTLAADPAFRAALARERDDIKDDLDDLRFYPVISVGLFFRF